MERLGTITFTKGEVTITDPCYDKGTWCSAVIQNVHKGEWSAMMNVMDTGSWGNRVESLTVKAVGQTVVRRERVNAEIGVDAGVCGIFEDKPDYTGDWSNVCDEMRSDFGGIADPDNAFRCVGVWSSSGYGDGCYDAYVGYNSDGEVVEITIDYGVECDDDYEENEDEDY